MRIVAQAQTAEQMFMALDKFRAATVLIIAGGFHSDFELACSLPRTRTRLASSFSRIRVRVRSASMAAGAHGVVYRKM